MIGVAPGEDEHRKSFSGMVLLIPMKVDSDSDLIPVTRSDGMPVRFGA